VLVTAGIVVANAGRARSGASGPVMVGLAIIFLQAPNRTVIPAVPGME